MKKTIKLLIAIAASCAIIAGFAACDSGEHTHTPDAAWHGDETSHWHECVSDKEVIEASKAEHTDADKLVSDKTDHWHVCDVCELIYGKTAHTPDKDWHTDGTNHWHECTECKAVIESTKGKNEVVTLPEYSVKAEYTGEALTCGLVSGKTYTVTYSLNGETVTPVALGVYDVKVSLVDKKLTKWSDGKTDDITFKFEITAKSVAVPTTEKTAYKCNSEGVVDLIAASEDYTVAGAKNAEEGKFTVTVTLKDKVNAKWADGTTDDKTFDFAIEHTYEWTEEEGVATYACVEHDGETKTLKLSVAERQDVVLNVNDDGASTITTALDLSSIGEYASVVKVALGETVLSENGALVPEGLTFEQYGEQNLVVTVKTADETTHEITVPVLLITEEISDFDRLVELVQIVDAKCGKFQEGKYYALADDITLEDGVYYNSFGTDGGNGLATVAAGNGFAGTLDGKDHSIVGGIMAGGGLFGSLQNATVKNIHFKDVQTYNNATVSVVTGSMYDSVLDNVTVTIKGAFDFTGNAQGIISSNRILNVTLNKVTINAQNCSYKSIFGEGWGNPTAKITCTDVVVNVKSLQCLTINSDTREGAKPALEIGEVTGVTGSMQAAVTPAEKFSLISNEFTLNLGEKFADATEVKSASYLDNELSVENWTLENGVLSGTTEEFGLTEVGSVSFVIAITSRGFDYTLTVEVVVESGYEKVTLENGADLIIANDGDENTEIAVDLGADYAGYTITDAIVGTTKLTVSEGKILVNDALKGVQTGAQQLTVQANDGEHYYEITMPAVVITESVTSFERLVKLVQITSATCGKFNEGKYFILGNDITLAAGTEYNSQVKPDGSAAYGYAGANPGHGFAGTLDGRKHSIIGGKMAAGGLFGSLQNATVKDINFTDVLAVNGAPISVITGGLYDSTIENVTITVKNSADVRGWKSDTLEAVGIISSNRNYGVVTLKNVTVNATGCSFESVFGTGYGNHNKSTYKCTDVIINVKSVQCLGHYDSGKSTLAIGEVAGITVNQAQTQE